MTSKMDSLKLRQIDNMRPFSKEEIKYMSDHMKRLDLELKKRQKELDQLPTKEDRIKRVLQISKELHNGKD